MNEKIELLKIAATLTAAYAASNENKSVDAIKDFFKDYSAFVFEHYDSLNNETNQSEKPVA